MALPRRAGHHETPRTSARLGRALLRASAITPSTISVAFAAGGFEVEHQVLHVQAKLAEGFLDEVEDAAAAFGTVDHAVEDRMQSMPELQRQ